MTFCVVPPSSPQRPGEVLCLRERLLRFSQEFVAATVHVSVSFLVGDGLRDDLLLLS